MMTVMRASSVILVLLLMCISGCAGGGSEGTGSVITRTFSGSVSSSQGSPISGVIISILETGTTAITSRDGTFSLEAALPSGEINLELKVNQESESQIVAVPITDEDSTNISVDIKLDPQNIVNSVSRIYMWARIVGECERFFANGERILQRRKTPPEVTCTLRFFVNGDTIRLENIPGAMEVRECRSPVWRPLVQGTTGVGANAGFGNIDFTFINNERNCQYRVVAPYRVKELPELEVRIDTLTYQNRKPGERK